MATAPKLGMNQGVIGVRATVRATLPEPTASAGQGGDLARRRYQKGQILFSNSRQMWLGRYREDVVLPDGTIVRTRPQVLLGTKRELPTRRLATRKLDEILVRINSFNVKN